MPNTEERNTMKIDLPESDWQHIVMLLRSTQLGQNRNLADTIEEAVRTAPEETVLDLKAYVVDDAGSSKHHALAKTLSIEAGHLYLEHADGTTVGVYAPGAWKTVEMREVTEDDAAADGAGDGA